MKQDKQMTEAFLAEFLKLLRRLYRAENSSGERQAAERSFIDGFMSAGLHLRLLTGPTLSEVIEQERAQYSANSSRNIRQGSLSFSEPERDFSEFDRPTWERKGE
ncbi:hypothetical protein N9O71_02260 [bacterium]|nr:hypothetical protein [bacterium]